MKEDKDYQAEADLRCVAESMEIRKDAKRWKAVQAAAKKQKEALEELGFNENTAKEVVGSILKDETIEPQHRLKAAEQVFKVHGSYAPEKSVSVNIEVKQNREKLAKVATEVMEKLSHEELNG